MGFVSFLLFYLKILLCSVGVLAVCGLFVGVIEKLFMRLTGRAGYFLAAVTSFIGTPVHELGHAAMCLIFAHKITDIKLWKPSSDDGVSGYVEHSYNIKNFYSRLGNVFISLGPIFSGFFVIILAVRICFPGAYGITTSSVGDISAFFSRSAEIVIALFNDASRPIWVRIIGFIILFSVSLHINLSIKDIKNGIGAFPFYMLVLLIISFIIWLFGGAAVSFASRMIVSWAWLCASMFVIIFTCSFIMLIPAFIIYIIRILFKKK